MKSTNVTELPPIEAYGEGPQLFVKIIYYVIAIVSILSNTIVIIVLLFIKKTNYELKFYLINLAVADIMIIISIPLNYSLFMLNRWIYPEILCK